jgi:thiamine-monophosphate kinase (thiamine-phosphatekinase)
MDKENFTIECFGNSYIGDDAAVLDKQVFSKDIFAENSHFKHGWLSLEEIGYKAMIVNFSDTIVMNARPKFALLGLSLPKNFSPQQIKELSVGINRACKEFGVKIIGGDTISSKILNISVSVIGELNGKAVLRKNGKYGDLVAFTGELGGSKKGLNSLLRLAQISKNSRFKKPILRDKFFYKAAHLVNSAMDISDGLNTDLAKLLKASKKGAKFTKKLSKFELSSGEEYEILFTFSPKNLNAIKRIAAKTRTKISIFAKISNKRLKQNARNHHF